MSCNSHKPGYRLADYGAKQLCIVKYCVKCNKVLGTVDFHETNCFSQDLLRYIYNIGTKENKNNV